MSREIEIKFRVADVRALVRRLRRAGFRMLTRRTHEMNTLYDLPGEVLRKRKELLPPRLGWKGRTFTRGAGLARGAGPQVHRGYCFSRTARKVSSEPSVILICFW